MKRLAWVEVTRPALRTSAWVTGALIAAGLPVGAIWAWVAPRADWVRSGGGGYLRGSNPEAFAAADDWFFFTALAAGAVAGALVSRLVRRDGPLVAFALLLGSLGGSYLAAVAGHWLTLSQFAAAAFTTAEGKPLDYFLTVQAKSVLFGWPLAAQLALVLIALRRWPRESPPEALLLAQPLGDGHPNTFGPPGERPLRDVAWENRFGDERPFYADEPAGPS